MVALERKEQTHLLALYGALCECVAVRDVCVREAVGAMLLQLGSDVGMLDLLGALPLDDA